MEEDLYEQVVEALNTGKVFRATKFMTATEVAIRKGMKTFKLDPLQRLIVVDQNTIKYIAKKIRG